MNNRTVSKEECYALNRNTWVRKIEDEIISRVLSNGGRWCELKMKTGETLRVVRTGYRSFEDFWKDSCKLVNENGETLIEADRPYVIAVYIAKYYH